MLQFQLPGEAVGVKAQLLDGDKSIIDSKKFSLDPEITTYDMLQRLLSEAFDIRGDFVISYLTVDDEEHMVQLPLLNDWDLDAAVLNCVSQSGLKLLVQTKSTDDGLSDWDVVDRCDIPSPRRIDLLPAQEKLVSKITDRLSTLLSAGRRSKTEASASKCVKPMTDGEFRNFLDCTGRLVQEQAFRESVYRCGVEQNLRKVAWRHLLNVFPPDLNGKERYEYLQRKSNEYMLLRSAWKSAYVEGIVSDEIKFITSMVRKDVIRTDRTHSFFKGTDDNKNTESLFDLLCTYSTNHPDVSYCQGMSDIASVVLVVQGDEANAYLCFCALMKRLKFNFLFDGVAMTHKFNHLKLLLLYYDPQLWHYMMENETQDLFFTYRWLLLELKREFAFNDSLYMLEVMWSTLPIDSPVDGVSLSDVYCLSSDGRKLISKHHASAALAVHNGSSSGTPTPYTKLLSLCRKQSSQSLTPVAKESTNALLLKSTTGMVESPTVASHHSSLCTRDEQADAAGEEPVEAKPTSIFYFTIEEDDHGTLQYTDDCSEAIGSSISSGSNCNGSSCGSVDSGIKTYSETPPTTLHTVSSELQFAFESSDSHKKPTNQAILPPPEEFGYGNPFLMFAAFTMIEQHRDHIIKNKLDFERIAMLFDRKIRKNDVHTIIQQTKIVYENYHKLNRQTYDC